MPIFRAGSKLVYFAHVPKCAGSSMLHYLRDRFGTVAFHNGRFHYIPEEARWSRTSPQHIDAETLAQMFPEGFFDASFAIVRHPVSRMVSAYHFQQDVEKSVARNMTFHDWLESIAAARAKDPFVFDNHVRPMDEIVPEGAKIFQLEKGFDPFIGWLDEISGKADGQRELPKVNERGTHKKGNAGKLVPTVAEVDLVAKIYARDFERFGYSIDSRKYPSGAEPAQPSRKTPLNVILRVLRLS